MGRFPVNAHIIPNPNNKIPGFSVSGITRDLGNSRGHLYCLPGFPVMAWPMIDWVLDTHYSHVFNSHTQLIQAILVFDLLESSIITLMERIETEFSPVKAYSLPSMGNVAIHGGKPHIELGCKAPIGNDSLLKQAMIVLKTTVTQLGGHIKAT
jgi:molybdopterin-biosynthesis enzyme MoeA-like protein